MKPFDWKSFLSQWSKELLDFGYYQNSPYYFQELPPEVEKSGWLGYPGADKIQIRECELRIGKNLPASYREFLKVSNGWRKTTPSIDKLWSTNEVDWFSVKHQDWIDIWLPLKDELEISDEEYYVYGEEQTDAVKVEHLQTALEISDVGDQTVYLLNPQVINRENEWEAWIFSAWDARRYRSFQELMQAEYFQFLWFRDHLIP